MATFDNIDTKDINQLTNSEFVDYADNDVVIIDDLRNFSKLQTIKLDFLLIIVVKSGRVAMKANKVDSTASCNDIIICQPNTILNDCLFSFDFTAKAVCLSAKVARKMLHITHTSLPRQTSCPRFLPRGHICIPAVSCRCLAMSRNTHYPI